jgi:hypothetical protein
MADDLKVIKANLELAIQWKDKTCISMAIQQYRKENIKDEKIEELIIIADSIKTGKTVEQVRQCKVDAETGNEVCELCSS